MIKQKKIALLLQLGKYQSDKNGCVPMYLFKNDLTKQFRRNKELSIWRRHGRGLLQKYLIVTDESQDIDIIFKEMLSYSCWEEKRTRDFIEIKVQLIGDKKEGKVKVVDVPEFERYAVEDRPKVYTHIFFFST